MDDSKKKKKKKSCACFLPWNAALAEEPASAGEELLERELKGDCLKHSSRNGLKQNTQSNYLHVP